MEPILEKNEQQTSKYCTSKNREWAADCVRFNQGKTHAFRTPSQLSFSTGFQVLQRNNLSTKKCQFPCRPDQPVSRYKRIGVRKRSRRLLLVRVSWRDTTGRPNTPGLPRFLCGSNLAGVGRSDFCIARSGEFVIGCRSDAFDFHHRHRHRRWQNFPDRSAGSISPRTKSKCRRIETLLLGRPRRR